MIMEMMTAAAARPTLDEVPALLRGLEERAVAKFGPSNAYAGAIVNDREWTVHLWHFAAGINKSFSAKTLPEALRAADDWLARDEAAEINLTLGLTADGRLPEAA